MYILKICEVKQISIKMACLVCLLFLAMYMDIQSYKIKNHLILSGLIIGLFINIYELGWTSIIIWFCGVTVPIFLLCPLFLFRVLGAGDIKLFSVIGGFFGSSFVLKSIIAAFLVAAIMSVIHLIKYKQVFYRLHHLVNYIQIMYQTNLRLYKKEGRIEIMPYFDAKRDGCNGVIHFSIAIFTAAIIQICMYELQL